MIELDDMGDPLWVRPEDVLSIEIFGGHGADSHYLQVRVAGYANPVCSCSFPYSDACAIGRTLAEAVKKMRNGGER
ncbi:hypothetical protein U0F71_06690 [Burkholderia pseudomallei]|uniref:hypothetical protein n=1 Tax=Burkholderia pseudomallei TaxID=28450 RepID=UPI002AB50707|nr:hypothetical protein [Burkholderia pseudomallei]MDY7815401.1 hypothetical protein [Burkholderia pseudomallei]MDY7862038.1 hypothetical protein [Burkholderia pseudomallei]